MEHRCDKRSPVKIDVMLYRGGGVTAVCKTRDVGMTGMFIETGSWKYRKNAVLDVEFVVELNRRHKRFRNYRLPAMVVRTSKDGIGLMFIKSAPEALLAWRLVVQRASSRVKKGTDQIEAVLQHDEPETVANSFSSLGDKGLSGLAGVGQRSYKLH